MEKKATHIEKHIPHYNNISPLNVKLPDASTISYRKGIKIMTCTKVTLSISLMGNIKGIRYLYEQISHWFGISQSHCTQHIASYENTFSSSSSIKETQQL